MFDAGVDPLGEVLASVRSLVAGFEVDGLAAPEAALVVERCAEAERLLGVLRVSAAGTLEDKALWRREGFRSVANWMAPQDPGLGRPVQRRSAATPIEAVRGRGSGSPRRTGTKTSPNSARSSRALDLADARLSHRTRRGKAWSARRR